MSLVKTQTTESLFTFTDIHFFKAWFFLAITQILNMHIQVVLAQKFLKQLKHVVFKTKLNFILP